MTNFSPEEIMNNLSPKWKEFDELLQRYGQFLEFLERMVQNYPEEEKCTQILESLQRLNVFEVLRNRQFNGMVAAVSEVYNMNVTTEKIGGFTAYYFGGNNPNP